MLKGIALILLLCHHCLYTGEGYNDIYIHGYPVFKSFGVFCKLCVSIFVFLSGYGLTKVAINNNGIGNPLQFYRKRYVKLMMNYWLIWLLFVPIGVLFFNRTFPDVYGNHFVVKSIVDFFGLYRAVYGTPYGYNATWWFYSCIIILYLLYPLLWKLKSYWFLLIPLSIISVSFGRIPILGSSGAFNYLLAFVCGLSLAFIPIPVGGRTPIWKLLMIAFFSLICLYRFFVTNSVLWDSAILIWGVYSYKVFPLNNILSRLFSFLGRHSFNIFLFHTFIYEYYFHNMVFWSSNPILIVLTLLVVCSLISVGIEHIKKAFRINVLQNKLVGM